MLVGQVDFSTWPEASAKERPKALYVNESLTGDVASLLRVRGWNPVDVRLLPNTSDADRAEAVKCTLEGVRIGTIQADKERLRHLELEARIYGLTLNRDGPSEKPSGLQAHEIDDLLSYARADVNVDSFLHESRYRRKQRLATLEAKRDE